MRIRRPRARKPRAPSGGEGSGEGVMGSRWARLLQSLRATPPAPAPGALRRARAPSSLACTVRWHPPVLLTSAPREAVLTMASADFGRRAPRTSALTWSRA